jgi:hypothetical protein
MSMMDKFKNIVKDTMYTGKDTTNSKLFKTIINQVIKSYGSVLAFKIDSKDRSFLIELMLKGETLPIRIEIKKYEFIQHGDSTSVIIYSLAANREWMQTIMDLFVLNKEFELPKKFDTPIQAFM